MKERITNDQAWLTVCMSVMILPLLNMITIAGEPNDMQQIKKSSVKEKQVSHTAVKMKAIDGIPSDPVFRNHSPQELIPFILGKKQLEGLENQGKDGWYSACS